MNIFNECAAGKRSSPPTLPSEFGPFNVVVNNWLRLESIDPFINAGERGVIRSDQSGFMPALGAFPFE